MVRLLRERTLGNSTTKLQKQVSEQHSEVYLHRVLQFLQAREPFHVQATRGLLSLGPPQKQIPPMTPVPRAPWFLAVFLRDVMSRLGEIKAKITSTFGSILKMDSTKKVNSILQKNKISLIYSPQYLYMFLIFQVTKKLAGKAAGTASWSTNVGNEHGQVLMSVLTDSEGDGLAAMTEGLVQRYSQAKVPPPKLLYVDRDCCSRKLQAMFGDWTVLVRLDIWHFMRRFAIGCASESHALYPVFMSQLSSCMFEWDSADLQRLRDAKKAELQSRGRWRLDEETVNLHISKRELQMHCKRRTRGLEETARLIQELLETFSSDSGKDTMGIPLLDGENIQRIWREQKHHIECIQDPTDIQLYTQTSSIVKGGLQLPVYRCARGSTSLESFHLHINRFILGICMHDIPVLMFDLPFDFRCVSIWFIRMIQEKCFRLLLRFSVCCKGYSFAQTFVTPSPFYPFIHLM